MLGHSRFSCGSDTVQFEHRSRISSAHRQLLEEPSPSVDDCAPMLERSTFLSWKAKTCSTTVCVWKTTCGWQSSVLRMETCMKSFGLGTPLSFWLNQVVDPPDAWRGHTHYRFLDDDMAAESPFRSTVQREAAAILFPSVVGESRSPVSSLDRAATGSSCSIFRQLAWALAGLRWKTRQDSRLEMPS